MTVLILAFFVLTAAVVSFSLVLADCVDLIDKKTSVSGAFIGGVVLAAVTSLPELFTSFSAVFVIDRYEMVVGNILGSNIFNMSVFGMVLLFCSKSFAKGVVGDSHLTTSILTAVLFALMYLPICMGLDFSVLNISVYSAIIVIFYVISIRFMSGDSAESEGKDDSKLTLPRIIVRFIIMAVLLIASSIAITVVADRLAAELKLGASLAGALLLGIVTSLPELTSSIALVRKGNVNASVGNLLGSGLFNFCILAFADVFYRKGSMYDSPGSVSLVIFGFVASALTIFTLIVKKNKGASEKLGLRVLYTLSGVGIIVCYVLFVAFS